MEEAEKLPHHLEVRSDPSLAETDTIATQIVKTDAPEWYFENIATLAHSARTIHIVYVGFLVFCGLTVISTTDRQIVMNEGARLPLLNVDVRFSLFLVIAPVVAICMFLYFQLHIHVMKQMRTELNIEYASPDKRRLYPWMINLADWPEVGAMGIMQRLIVNLSLWWLLPTVLFLFTLVPIKMGNSALTYVELLISAASVVLVLWLYNRYKNISAENEAANSGVLDKLFSWMDRNMMQIVLVMIVTMCYVQLFRVIPVSDTTTAQQRIDLRGQVFKGAHLRGVNLRSARLDSANFEEANLSEANLQNANFTAAVLKQVNVRDAKLTGARLNCAELAGAHLEGADLTGAYLAKADLSGTYVTSEQLSQAKTLFDAKMDPALRSQLQNTSHGRDLISTPRSASELIASYKSKPDPITISNWKKVSFRPKGFENDARQFLISDQYERLVLSSRSNPEIRDRIPNEEWRIFTEERTALTNSSDDPHSAIEIRFFATITLEGERYLRTEEVSRISAPCSQKTEQEGEVLRPESYTLFVGHYQVAANVILTVQTNGRHLIAQIAGTPPEEFYPASDARFVSRQLNSQMVFSTSQGQVTSVVITRNGLNLTAKKIN